MSERRKDVTPPDPLGNLVENLWILAIPLVVGMAVGSLTVLLLRAAGLRWTWALLGVPVAWLAWLVDFRVGLGCAAAVATASGAGAYWHMEAVERGGTEARVAREMLPPARWVWSYAMSKRQRRHRVKGADLAIGQTRRGTVCRIPFGFDRGVHGVVLGATGSGKTVSQAALAQAYILSGRPAIVIDPKGDPLLRDVLEDAARQMGRRFLEWTPQGPTVYNPFGRGGPTEVTDKALAGHRWGDEYYRSITQRLLLKVLVAMQNAGEWPPTLRAIVRYMDPEALDQLAGRVEGEFAEEISIYVDALSARQRADLSGGRDRMAILVEGELGRWIDPAAGAGSCLDPGEVLAAGNVGLFQLEADRYPVASQLLGQPSLSTW